MKLIDAATCTAAAFRNPDLFVSPFDAFSTNEDYARSQYTKGLEIGRSAAKITIAINGVWGAAMKDGSSVSSCEKLGYHAHTAALLRGFLDSGCPIVVFRRDGMRTVEVNICACASLA